MSQKPKTRSSGKNELHPRNQHRLGYDFQQLSKTCPELSAFVVRNKYQNETIDFSNAAAVKTLNKALLMHFYGIGYWDIPPDYLCPPVPGRADYIHYAADLLTGSNKDKLPPGKVKVLDIGTGANLVYPIIGRAVYGWEFVGSDIDPVALQSARKITERNPSLKGAVECRLQQSSTHIFKGLLLPDDVFDLSVCNPPFHASLEEAQEGTKRKWENLGVKKINNKELNFGGQHTELWCEGGERSFVHRMMVESAQFPSQCFWYSTLLSKSTNLPAAYGSLEKVKAVEVKTIEMAQGNKVSRMLAWTFLDKDRQEEWRKKRWDR